MPPRLLAVLIVGFWLTTTGWLVWRDMYPRFRTGEPPRPGIDLVDEASQKYVHWHVLRNDKVIARAAKTWTVYDADDDTWSLHSEAKELELAFSSLGTVRVPYLSSVYRIGRDGELRGMRSEIRAVINSALLKVDVPLAAELTGTVRDGRFLAEGWYEVNGTKEVLKLEPVQMSARAAVLNPLHPVNRLINVRPGQRWRMPVLDPLADAVRRSVPGLSSLGEVRPRILDAEVLVDPRTLEWNEGEAMCLVIEYRDNGELVATTWVHMSDGRVLRQEAMQGGEQLVLRRQ